MEIETDGRAMYDGRWGGGGGGGRGGEIERSCRAYRMYRSIKNLLIYSRLACGTKY